MLGLLSIIGGWPEVIRKGSKVTLKEYLDNNKYHFESTENMQILRNQLTNDIFCQMNDIDNCCTN